MVPEKFGDSCDLAGGSTTIRHRFSKFLAFAANFAALSMLAGSRPIRPANVTVGKPTRLLISSTVLGVEREFTPTAETMHVLQAALDFLIRRFRPTECCDRLMCRGIRRPALPHS